MCTRSDKADENEKTEGGACEGAKRTGGEEAVVPAETRSQTIERVELFLRWLCQVRLVRSLVSFSLALRIFSFWFSFCQKWSWDRRVLRVAWFETTLVVDWHGIW